MYVRRHVCVAFIAATAMLAFGAAAASSGTASSPPATSASPNKVGVKYTVDKFVRRGNHLYASGTAIARSRSGKST